MGIIQEETRSQDNTNFTRNDYKVLITLYNEGCFTEMKALPIKAIKERVKLSTNKVRQALSSFLKLQYIEEGATMGRAKTYYVTQNGIIKIKNII